MNTSDAIRKMLTTRSLSMRAASLKLGRSDNFLYETTRKKLDSQARTVAEIAEVCGYSLVLVPHGATMPDGAIYIDKGKDGEMAKHVA